jgi:hypothetical protein
MSYTAPKLLSFGNALRVTLGSDSAGPDSGNGLIP